LSPALILVDVTPLHMILALITAVIGMVGLGTGVSGTYCFPPDGGNGLP
jgi:hypothetical protein